MSLRRALSLLVISVSLGGLSGCGIFGRKPKPKITIPPAPTPGPASTPAPTPSTEPAPSPPPKPTPKPTPPRPKPAPTQAPPSKPDPAPSLAPAPTPAPAPPPSFGQILTPEQQADAVRMYEASSKAALQSLARTNGKALTRDQLDTANRVRSLLKQAQDARQKAPATAAQLAKRAEILADDLAGSVQ